ncbi:uncharacterized protein LOC143227251 [Tachypleus tridentatus]|uniref:uncharacterized protein LOC143227251 n=1 Tax=Tachypleus tridentatus TaxID=6853 RepID=UPI003FD32C85
MWKELITFAASSNPLKIIILLLMIWHVTGYGNFDEDKRQTIIPYPRHGRFSSTWMEGKRQDVIPYPRVGRPSWDMTEDKRQGLVPFPRLGRSEDKQFQLTLIPRAGHAYYNPKRDIMGDNSLIQHHSVLSSYHENQNADYQTKNEIPNSHGKDLNMKLRQVIPAPRFGRSYIPGIKRHNSILPYSVLVHREEEKRSFFTPRDIRTPFTLRVDRLNDDNTVSNIVHQNVNGSSLN